MSSPSHFQKLPNGDLAGISGTVLKILMTEFNFTIDLIPTNTYNDMLIDLSNNGADLATNQITHIEERLDILSPGLTLEKMQVGVIFWKSPYESTDISSLLYSFDFTVWMTIGAIMFSIYILLLISKRIYATEDSTTVPWIQAGVVIVRALFGHSFDEKALFGKTQSRTGSLLVLTLSLTGFIIFVWYTSIFTSSLAIKELKIPFRSMKEFSQLSSFKIRSYNGGSTSIDLRRIAQKDAKISEAVDKFIVPHFYNAKNQDPGNSHMHHRLWFRENRGPKVGMLFEEYTLVSIFKDTEGESGI